MADRRGGVKRRAAGKALWFGPRLCVVCVDEFVPKTRTNILCRKEECGLEWRRRTVTYVPRRKPKPPCANVACGGPVPLGAKMFCSAKCMRAVIAKRRQDFMNELQGGATTKRSRRESGDTGVLLVAADLRARGYYVYFSPSETPPCDMVVCRAGERALRVEAKTSLLQEASMRILAKRNRGNFDVLALVERADGSVKYEPDAMINTITASGMYTISKIPAQSPHIVAKVSRTKGAKRAYMDCALRLRERHALRADQIAEVRCRTAEGPIPRLWEPLAAKQRPRNGYAAKFSLPYLLASILVNGRATLADFTDEAVQDEGLRSVAAKVFYDIDPTIDYPRHFIGHVAVRLTDGRVLEERQDHPRGGPDFPMTREELTTKFHANAALAISDAQAARVGALVEALPTQPRVSALMDALTA